MSKVYYCYSRHLKVFLEKNGEEVIATGKHPRTDKRFWMFLRNQSLDALLGQWSTHTSK